jgi:hypothetical protein
MEAIGVRSDILTYIPGICSEGLKRTTENVLLQPTSGPQI